MKKLIILRHAKSSWKYQHLNDFERPLNKRGKRDVPIMAKSFMDIGIPISQIITSPSKRTIDTAKIFSEILNFDLEIIVDKRLYNANYSSILEILKELDEKHQNILLVAHNPGITEIVNYLASLEIENIPTCGLVGLNFNGKWADIDRNSCSKMFYEYPKILKKF